MKVNFADLNYQYKVLKKKIDNNLKKIFYKSAFIGGSFVTKLEKDFSQYCNVKYCIGVGNGTDAIEIAIQSLNLKKNSEIIIPANTFIATAEAVIRSGHRVKFIDVHYKNNLLDEEKLDKIINKNTSCIIPVHLFGQSCEMQKIMKIAKKNNLKVIEDCSQAHGSLYKKKHVGTFGDLGTFSFYPGKNLGGFGDGGAIITNKKQLFIKCKRISNHGRLKKFDHKIMGRNSRLDNIQAAIIIEKLKVLNKWISQRNKNANIYNNTLDLKYIDIPEINSFCYHSYHLYVVKINHRDKVRDLLRKKGISTGIHYPQSLNDIKIFSKNKQKIICSTLLSKKIISLPIHESLRSKDIKFVSNTLNKIVRDIN